MKEIESFYGALDEAQSNWENIYNLLKQGQYDFDSPKPAIGNTSVDMLNRRAQLFFEITQGLRPGDDNGGETIALSISVSDLQPKLNSLRNATSLLFSQIHNNWRENAIIKDKNNNFSWQFYVEPNVIADFDVVVFLGR